MSSGFLMKDSYKIDDFYIPVFHRITDLLYIANISYKEVLAMSLSELNMLHYMIRAKKDNETKYWSNYFIELVKAIFGDGK